MVVGAIDQDAARTHLAHVAKGDLDRAVCGSLYACGDQSGARVSWQNIDLLGAGRAASYSES
ncbi:MULTISPECIES: hypothetical protein [unclassified Bradyrhizobium]|uniref:hypothetical protein n=1 Tax=unclassified Bradyrhizobium TaxID=2631580 RepID=UPI0012EC8C94|nr:MULTISPECIES: hypothetical protein [unclassified Bradyrhizobium]MCP3466687.1 hypothetical protein [Bradyrhizobium sp. CCGUVB23]